MTKPITCRPADLIEPQLEKIEAEMKQWKQQDEDVLTYALFPQVAKEFFESRPAKKPPVEKREILKAAAPEVKKAPVSTEENGWKRHQYLGWKKKRVLPDLS